MGPLSRPWCQLHEVDQTTAPKNQTHRQYFINQRLGGTINQFGVGELRPLFSD